MIEEMLPLMRRLAGVADFVEGLRGADISPARFAELLHGFQQGVHELGVGRTHEAVAALEQATREQPDSAPAAGAVAAAQAADRDLYGAESGLTRAVRLRPEDGELADLQRRVTRATRAGVTPSAAEAEKAAPRPRVSDTLDGWRLEQMLGHGG